VTIPDALVRLVDVAFSVVAIGVLFGLIYKVVPDAEIRWRDVLEGAAAASLMFAIGKMLLSYYIAHSSLQSTYGAAGSFVVLLLWVYYSAQILFFGAELTQICTRRRRPVAASEGAVKTVAFRPQRAAKRR
jgi:membrane protein